LRKTEDAPLNDRLKFDRFTVIQDSVESNELFIAGITGCNSEFHL
jgi:hypothetical protein